MLQSLFWNELLQVVGRKKVIYMENRTLAEKGTGWCKLGLQHHVEDGMVADFVAQWVGLYQLYALSRGEIWLSLTGHKVLGGYCLPEGCFQGNL